MAEPDMAQYDIPNLLTNLAMRVGQMEGTMKTFMDNWARQDQLAHDSRRVVYDRLELIGKQVERVATDVVNIQQDVAELKKEIDEQVMPTIESVEARKHRVAGAKGVWAMIGAGVVMVASALAYLADKLSAYLFPRH